MELGENLYSDSCWDIYETTFDPAEAVAAGSNFMTGNGYLGYRGTFPFDRKDAYVACIVSDTYDNADGKWTELVNAPNPLFIDVLYDGVALRPPGAPESTRGTTAYRRGLEFRQGRFTCRWKPGGTPVKSYRHQRFAGYARLHTLPAHTEIEAAPGTRLRVRAGIDGEVWNLNGEHLVSYSPEAHENGGRLSVTGVTGEKGIVVVSSVAHRVTGAEMVADQVHAEEKSIYRDMSLVVGRSGTVTIESYAAIYSSNDVDDPAAACFGEIDALLEGDWDTALAAHREKWDAMWEDFDIVVENDELSQTLLRYNTYHNVIATPAHTDHLPIGARGLSCQAYQGAAFWDQEIFNLPMFLYTRPQVARNILRYRYRTIAGARKKARDLGWRGAFYAWVSADTGEEICPSYFFVDVLSGRRIRNHFNDWQIHISPDIVYTIARYLEVTGDESILVEGGAEIIFSVARFLYSRVHFSPARRRYEILRVLGPDEYHENVDNNTFTNYQSRYALVYAARLFDRWRRESPDVLRRLADKMTLDVGEVAAWREVAELLFVRSPREDGLIEQFDGFFGLEDITPDDLAERLKDPGEYWGWPNGIAVETQVSKQADVMQLVALHPELYDSGTIRRNWEYYEKRTQHGSSLSPSVYSMTAAWIGRVEEAYRYFLKSGTVDLFGGHKAVSGGTFIGGIHTAAAGAAWQMAVFGFAGLRADAGGVLINPHLPTRWSRLAFSILYRGNRLEVDVGTESMMLSCPAENTEAVPVRVPDDAGAVRAEARLAPGQALRVELA